MLSGSATPMETMPVWLQDVMQIFPTPHFVSFARRSSTGRPASMLSGPNSS